MNRNMIRFGPSPNEEAQLIREEYQRRRKLRIQQVRQQQRSIALQIRREVEHRRECELAQLEEELREKWEQQQQEKFSTLQRLYHENLQFLGQAHRSAKENEPDLAAQALKQEENQVKAEERYREALKEFKVQKLKDLEKQNRPINARKKALQAEKKRAAMVANLPPPPQNPIQNIESTQLHVVKKSDVSTFATTHHHMPKTAVFRVVDIPQIDARVEATLELRKLEDLKEKVEREKEEQVEKARARGKQALRKEQLIQDRERLLVELEHMQQTCMLKRRQQVSQMPLQTFQPYSKRQEMREDFQRDLEFAFEDMCTGERRAKEDPVLQLVPDALPAASTSSHSQEPDVDVEHVDAETENGIQEERRSSEQEPSVQALFRPRPRQTLKKLFDRIRSQQNEWSGEGSLIPEPECVAADLIPERDTTIDTGSLTNEDRDVAPPVEVPESFHLAEDAAPEAPEHSAVSDCTHPPDEYERRIQEYEQHRKKRDEELEREKQQQILLLRELEEQKAKLEQMLHEAQQEQEPRKAAVTPQVSSVIHAGVHESAPPAGEDDHNRKIREYQRRLLEQDRNHQMSVKVARQRLEEYQKTLRLRYNVMSPSLLPAVVPSDVSHTPLVCAECDNLLPPPRLHTNYAAPEYTHNARDELHIPVDVPTRDPAVSKSPSNHSDPSVSCDSRLFSREPDSVTESPDVAAQPSHDVTEHLSEKLPPYLGSTGYMFHKRTTAAHDTIQNTRHDERQLPGQTVVKPVTVSQSSMQAGSSGLTGEDMARQRQELQEVQRWVLEQKDTIALHQRRQEEERRKLEMAQIKRQKEALQGLITSDVQLTPEGGGRDSISLESSQTRREILASLLKAIEESNGGTLSHFRNDHDEASDQQPSTSGLAQVSVNPSSVQVTKPPVTRVRSHMEEVLSQHQLSVIQEVDTPIDTSLITGLEDRVTKLPHTVDWTQLEDKESLVGSDGTVHTPSVESRGEQSAERTSSSGTNSRRSSLLHWRERVQMTAGSPESGLESPGLRIVSRLPDSGRWAESSCSSRCLIEMVSGLSDPDRLSSTTISTGSYVTTDPEHNQSHTDRSPSVSSDLEERREDLPGVSCPSEHGSFNKDRVSSVNSTPAVNSLFDSSTIQSIIDKYTKELAVSLDAIGTTTGRGSHGVQPGSSFSHQASPQVLERREEEPEESFSPRPSTALYSGLVQASLGHITDEGLSLSEDKNSFRPLIGRLADQSSCLPEEQRTSAMEHLVGHPSAHSSMISHLPGQTASVSLDQSGQDSTQSRMIGRLSNQSSSHWLSIRQDVHPRHTGQMELGQSPMCLDEGHEETQMRPLLGEVDESVGQQSESLGEMSYVDLGVSHPAEIQSHSVSVLSVSPSPHPQDQMVQNQMTAQDSGRTQLFDSFRPLLAEVTHNETTDSSMTAHLHEHEVSDSPGGLGLDPSQSVLQNSSTEFETRVDPSLESESLAEQLRAEEPPLCRTASSALHESFCRLVTSHDSVFVASSTAQDVQLAADVLSTLTVCDSAGNLDMLTPEEMEAERSNASEKHKASVEFRDSTGVESNGTSDLEAAAPFMDKMLDTLSEKGILEQSEITLVSLTDTTLQDHDASLPQELGSTLLAEETPEEDQIHPAFLEFPWGSSRDLQEVFLQKREALIQKSSQRLEELKAKRTTVVTQRPSRGPSESGKVSKTKQPQQVPCGAKTRKPRQKIPKADKAGGFKHKKHKNPPVPEVKICTTEQRKQDVSEMHQRTRRLYEQLEEVKHQNELRSRHEVYAKNRLKAQEFHKKTLQKLRAKQQRQ